MKPSLSKLDEYQTTGDELEEISPSWDLEEDPESHHYLPNPVEGVVPDIDMSEDALSTVEYSIRGPRDVVLSGPVGPGWGPGTWYPSRGAAYQKLEAKYGKERIRKVPTVMGRWAFLIVNLKGE